MNFENDRRPWQPLPGDVQRLDPESGLLFHELAMQVAEENVMQALEDGLIPNWSGHFVLHAMYAAVTQQSVRNNNIVKIAKPPLADRRWDAMLSGTASPDEIVSLRRNLGKRASGMGMEEGRHSHAGVWDTEDTIDAPIRRELVNNRSLGTFIVEGQPIYKLKYDHRNGEIVERKRLIMTHFGDPLKNKEYLWTMRRDLMLVDFEGIDKLVTKNGNNLSDEQLLDQEQALNLKDEIVEITSNPRRDFDARVSSMNDLFEPLIDQPIDHRPSYLYPLLTTVFLREPTENLKSEEETGSI